MRIQVEPAATTSGIGFALASGGAIEGVVADAGDGRPLGGIAVHVFLRESGRALGAVRTNGSGFFVTGLPAGTFAVATSNTPGYVDQLHDGVACPSLSCAVVDGAPVAVVAGQAVAGIGFSLARGATISGSVRTSKGAAQAIPGGIYSASGVRVATVESGSGGMFTAAAALPAGTYFVRTEAPIGYANQVYRA